MRPTTASSAFATLRTNLGTTTLLVAAIALGATLGTLSDGAATRLGGWIDPTIVALVTLLIFEMRPEGIRNAGSNLRFVAIAWACNFLVIPTIGYGVASLFLHGQPLAFTGLVIYFMAPCTDWFLGFTRLAKGNATLGAALIPINMVSQLALYPVYLHLFAGTTRQTGFQTSEIPETLIRWFLVPFVVAIGLHLVLRLLLPARPFARLLDGAGSVIPWVIALLVVEIFAANVSTIHAHLSLFALILVAVFVFFVATWLLGEGVSRLAGFAYPEHALLTMTTAARNAPLMLGITAAAIPDQPLIYAALVIGMLVEFPHLTALKHLLLRRRPLDADEDPMLPATPSTPAREDAPGVMASNVPA